MNIIHKGGLIRLPRKTMAEIIDVEDATIIFPQDFYAPYLKKLRLSNIQQLKESIILYNLKSLKRSMGELTDRLLETMLNENGLPTMSYSQLYSRIYHAMQGKERDMDKFITGQHPLNRWPDYFSPTEELDLSNNLLFLLPDMRHLKIKKLNLSGNWIKQFNLYPKYLIELQELDLSNNKLQRYKIYGKNLRTVDLTNNEIIMPRRNKIAKSIEIII
ncbi:MAG: hypothetical protein INQ03_09185 [Candidatus Heimdallarchaeota archaeon]|nr:hypothetical protein [Candidatus Heimdallarchaeota archaeon]